MNTRNWSIPSKIVAMVSVPVAGLLALWIVVVALVCRPVLRLADLRTLVDELVRPGERVVAELRDERRLAVAYLVDVAAAPGLAEQRARTDEAIAAFRRRVSDLDVRDLGGAPLATRVDQLLTTLDDLPSTRDALDARRIDRTGLFEVYNGIIDAAFRMFTAVAAVPEGAVSREAHALVEFGVAAEMADRADALLAGAFHANRFGPGEDRDLLRYLGAARALRTRAVADLPPTGRARYQQLADSAEFARVRALEERLLAAGSDEAAPPIAAGEWRAAYDAVRTQQRQLALDMVDELGERSWPSARRGLIQAMAVGCLGLATAAVAMVLAVRVGRSFSRRLAGMRTVALDVAGTRLPAVVARLRAGDAVDVQAEAPSLDYGTDEIGQVGHAVGAVQRSAIRSVAAEAAVRRGFREIVLAVTRRSQVLLHQQLSLLDAMERRATDPVALRDLYALDHLATRLRRCAEDLLLLSGARPGRGWTQPVPMVDVIRGAMSEVERYDRVDLDPIDGAALDGRAVADVTHVLAELIDNATAHSPPEARVRIRGSRGDAGYTIEIEDRGFGMTRAAIAEANRRLAEAPEFDTATGEQLGLFVVAHLAARHGVGVSLRPTEVGGVIATVRIPADLVVTDVAAPPGGAAAPDPPLSGGKPSESSGGEPTESSGGESDALPRRRAPGLPRRRASLPVRRPAPAESESADPPGEPPRGDSGAATPAPVTEEKPPPTRSRGGGELPRRARQQNMAPQLRESSGPSASADSGRLPTRRSPQQVRSVVAALQAGAARGRREAALPVSTPAAGAQTADADRGTTEAERSR